MLTPFLGIRSLYLLLLFSMAIVFGCLSYALLQERYQRAMLDAVIEADVIGEFCDRQAGLKQDDCYAPRDGSERTFRLSDQLIWSLLVDARVIDPADVESPARLGGLKNTDPGTANVVQFLVRRTGTGANAAPESAPVAGTGLKLLMDVTGVCIPLTFGAETERLGFEHTVAATLGDLYPTKDGSSWWGAVPRDPLQIVGRDDLSFADLSERSSVLETLSLRREIPSDLTDARLISALFVKGLAIQAGSDASLVPGYPFAEPSRCVRLFERSPNIPARDAFVAFKGFENLALYVAGRIRTAAEVRDARFWLTIVTGWEQLIILCLFWFGLILVLIRLTASHRRWIGAVKALDGWTTSATGSDGEPLTWAQRRDQAFDWLASSKWPMRLTLALLPTVGFIGTVRGIMLSLNGADQIVWANTINERSAAISNLSGDLGLAFATTMLALLAGFVLTILNAIDGSLSEAVILRHFDEGE